MIMIMNSVAVPALDRVGFVNASGFRAEIFVVDDTAGCRRDFRLIRVDNLISQLSSTQI